MKIACIVLLAQLALALACFPNLGIYTTEDEMKEKLDQLLKAEPAVDIPFSCLEYLLENGFYKTALEMYEAYFSLNDIDRSVFAAMKQRAQGIKRDLESLQNIIMASNKEIQVAEPAFQWAQNKSHVFIQVKLALRLDSPACLNCREEKVLIEENRLFMSVFGVISHSPVRYLLNLTLSDNVSVKDSYWNYESVGTYFFSLAKKIAQNEQDNGSTEEKEKPKIDEKPVKTVPITQSKEEVQTLWLELEKESKRKVPLWWDMREKHKKDMDEWIQLREEHAENVEKAKREERRRAKLEKKQARVKKEQQQKESVNVPKTQEEVPKTQEEGPKKEGESWGNWFSNLVN